VLCGFTDVGFETGTFFLQLLLIAVLRRSFEELLISLFTVSISH
jgi:hypothetical protein